ncbi:MAG: hypothetical protein ACRDUS_05055 [Mycobacterium sp.]
MIRVMLGVLVTLALCSPVAVAEPLSPEDAFAQRAPLQTCGRLRALPPTETKDIPYKYLDCMRRARAAGTGAELAAAVPTIFNDTVTAYYRVHASDRPVEIFVEDNDRRNNPGWEHYFCPIPDTELTWSAPDC